MLPPGCRLGELSQFSCLKLKVFAEELCQRVPWNVVAFTAVVEVAVGGTGDDKQLLIVGIGIGFADEVVAFGLSVYHVVEGGLAKVARVGLGAVHHKYGRANLVDVVEEAGIGVGLGADGCRCGGGSRAGSCNRHDSL